MDDRRVPPVELPGPTTLRTDRLLLRPWRGGDAAAVHAACQDPQVQRWTQVPVPYTREHAEAYVRDAERRRADGEAYGLAVCDLATGELLASVDLRPGDVPRGWGVGCWAAPQARGRGVVPEAVAELARWAFGTLGAERLEWCALAGNWPSRRAAQRAGFTAEGLLRAGLRHRGHAVDGWISGRLRGDPEGDTALLPRLPELAPGNGLLVRRWREQDAPAVVGALGQGLFVPGMQARTGQPYEQLARWWLTEKAPGREESGAGLAASVWDGGDLVGSLQLMLAGRRSGICELGVWVAPPARRRGVALGALAALLDWAAPALSLRRAEWVAAVDNPASVALAGRLGFVREGLARSALPDGAERRQDAIVLARTWPAPAATPVPRVR